MARHLRPWDESDISIVRDLMPNYQAILKALPHRTYPSIRYQAQKLGLCPQRRRWTGRKVSDLHKLYPTAPFSVLLRRFPDETKVSLKAMAKYYGLHRPRLELVATGSAVLDDIRALASVRRLSMVDLDKIADTKLYFTQARWCGRAPNYLRVGRAAEALGGELYVEWED